MAEEIIKAIDPQAEARKVVQHYLTGLQHARQLRQALNRQLLRGADWDKKYQEIVGKEAAVDEAFSVAINFWKERGTRSGKDVLWSIMDLLKSRHDLTPMGQSIVARLGRELSGT